MFCSGINFVAEFPSFRVADWKILTGCRGEDDGLTLLTPSWHRPDTRPRPWRRSPRPRLASRTVSSLQVFTTTQSWSWEIRSHDRPDPGRLEGRGSPTTQLRWCWRWWSADEVEVPAHLLRPGHAVDHDVGQPVPAPPPLAQAVAVEADAVVPVQGLLRILALQCNNN